MKQLVTLRRALTDPHFFGLELDGSSWDAMKALVLAALGEELTEEERELFHKLTQRDREPLARVKRLV